MQPIDVERSIWIRAPREQVWRAVTQAEQIMRWWSNDHWEISVLEVGAAVRFGNPADPLRARVAVVEPPRVFAIRWEPHPLNHATAMLTTFRLEEQDGGTLVTVTESGYEALPEDVRQRRLETAGRGYAAVLASLKTYVEPAA